MTGRPNARSAGQRDGSAATAPTTTDEAEQEERQERLADSIGDRLDKPMTAAGVIFLLLVLAETISRPTGTVSTVFSIASWVLWAAFVAEFVLRLAIAPSWVGYLRRNWWQLIFLAVPFLRFLRAVRAVRAARMGRVVSSAIRSSRTAGRRLSSRLTTVGVVTVIVVLAGSQLFFETGEFEDYSDALHAATLATVSGTPTGRDHGLVQLLEVGLIVYSVAVFAALAGSIGAYFLERNASDAALAARAAAPAPVEG